MLLAPRPSGDFSTEAFDFISPREGLRFYVYGDQVGVPTLGHGYALVVRGANGGWVLKGTLDADLLGIGITLTPAQRDVLSRIVLELNIGNAGLDNFALNLSNTLGDQNAPDHIETIDAAKARYLSACRE